MFQNTEVCKKAARRTEDPDLSTDYGYGREPSYMNPPIFDSVSKPRAPSYYASNPGTSIRKEAYNPTSHAPDFSTSLHPRVACAPSLPNNSSNVRTLNQYQQEPVTAPQHQVHYSQQPSQRLHQGQIVTFPSESSSINDHSDSNGNNVLVVNQFGARSSSAQQKEKQQQAVTVEASTIGVKEQARKNEKNSRAFRP